MRKHPLINNIQFGYAILFWMACSAVTALQGQKLNNVWVFGNHAGLDFNTEPPTVLDTTSLEDISTQPMKYVSSICDKNGQLLFYTDGTRLWDKRDLGIDFYKGWWPWTLQVVPLICPYPGNDSLYYLFGVSTGSKAYALHYVTINAKANNGLGEVLYPQPATETNYYTTLLHNASLFLAGTKHCNGRDYWILSHAGNSFYSYLVTDDGVQSNAVVSTIPPGILPPGTYKDLNIKFSASGEKLLVPCKEKANVVCFDFNRATGALSNPMLIQLPEKNFLDDVEISPDGSKLYIAYYQEQDEGEQHFIKQYNLNAGNANQVERSAYILNNLPDRANFCSPHFCVFLKRTLELAPNGKIYISMTERTDRKFDTKLSIIESPNDLQGEAFYKKSSLDVKRVYRYMKYNYIRSNAYSIRESGIQFKKNACYDKPVTFSLITAKIDSVKWDFGDTASGSNNFSALLNPAHQYPAPGSYHVRAVIYTQCMVDTAFATVSISEDPSVKIPAWVKDTAVCKGSILNMDVTTPNATSYEWETGYNRPVKELDQDGEHRVRVMNGCSFDTRSFKVVFENCDCNAFVPTAFTPNGDGLNDVFKPIFKCAGLHDETACQFTVYSRYGNILFTTNTLNECWNGNSNNVPVANGLYQWVLKFVDPNTKQTVIKNGSVTLLR